MQYGWWTLPNPLGGQWISYRLKLDEYARELANIINRLIDQEHRLRAWSTIVAPMSDHEKFQVSHEFVENIGTVALGLPYAIKSRFAFAAAHLSHEANPAIRVAVGSHEFPTDDTLYLNAIDPICCEWTKFRKFKLHVEPIAGRAFNNATSAFRHAYNHRFPRRFLFGHTSRFSREIDDNGREILGFGTDEPLEFATICRLLERECKLCCLAFKSFQDLVREQTEEIGRCEAAQNNN